MNKMNYKKIIAITFALIMVLSGLGILASDISAQDNSSHLNHASPSIVSSGTTTNAYYGDTSTWNYTVSGSSTSSTSAKSTSAYPAPDYPAYPAAPSTSSWTLSWDGYTLGSGNVSSYDITHSQTYTHSELKVGSTTYYQTTSSSTTSWKFSVQPSYTWTQYGSLSGVSAGWTLELDSQNQTGTIVLYSALYSTSVIVSGPTYLKPGQDGTFTSSVPSTFAPSSYQWYLDGSAISGATSSTYTTSFSASTNYSIFFLATNSTGFSYESTTLNGSAGYTLSISAVHNPADAGQSVDFSTSVSGGSGTYSYSYVLYDGTSTSDAELDSGTTSSFDYTFGSVGSYLLVYSSTDSNGFNASSTLTEVVNSDPSVSITSSQNPTDVGNSVTFIGKVSGGTGPYEYSWTIGGTSVTSTSIQYPISISGSPAGSGTYQQEIAINNPSQYGINANASNILITYSNGTPAYSWIQSINSTSLVVWSKLANGTSQVDLQIFSISDNLLSANGYIGEAPQLSTTYAEYDNGKNVFPFYDNFAGTSLGSEWTVPSGSNYNVSNGFIASPSGGSTTAVYDPNITENSNIIVDYGLNLSSTTYSGSSNYFQLNRYTPYVNEFFLGYSGSSTFENNLNNIGSTSIPSTGEQLFGIWNDGTTATWYYPYSSYTNTSLTSESSYLALGWAYNGQTYDFPTINYVFTREYVSSMPSISISSTPQSTNGSELVLNYNFTQSGSYTVDLTVKDAANYSVSTSISQTVNSDPTVLASSNVSSADIGYPIEFSSSPSGGTGPYTYSWVLNGNVVSTSQDFSYSFASSGSYTLTVTITDSVGKTTSATVSVTINSNPSVTATASQNPTDVGNSMTFASTISGGTGTLTYSWLVNGVQESTSSSFTYSFNSTGSYTVNLTVTDADGHVAYAQFTEKVNADPSVSIHANHNPTDVGVSVNLTSSISGGTPGYKYSWTVNGNNFNTSYVDYTFTSAGTYTISLKITDKNGNTATASISEVVNPDPSVSISVQYNPVDQGINDTLQAVISGGTSPFNYTWTLGSQVLNYSQEFHYAFASTGTYTINLTITDSQGLTSSTSVIIKVIAKPSAAIEGVNKTDISTETYWEGYGSYGTAPYQYYWYVNGVNTSSGLYLEYSFPKTGNYNISILIVDSQGDKAHAYLNVTVEPKPTITISSSSDATDVGNAISFSSSLSGGSPFYNYTWRISSLGFVGYQKDLTYQFSTPGTYNVTVEVTDGAGNTATASITITIHSLPNVSIKAQYSNIDTNITDSFNSNVSGGTAPYTYAWYINGNYEGNGTSISYSFADSGTYSVELKIRDATGATVSYRTDISVQAYPVASIISSRSAIDANVADTFRASGTGGVGPYTYEWIIGGHTFSNDTVSYSFASSGNYTVQLVISDSFGKDSSNTTVITVFPDPQVSVHWTGKPVVSKLFHMSANITGGIGPYSVSWIFPSGQHESGLNITHVFSSSGPETFEVEVSDKGGYSGTTNYTIQVGLYVSITSSTRSGLAPLAVQFSSSVLGGSDYSYNWTFSPGHYSLEQNPEYTFGVGNYTVHFVVTSSNGAKGYGNISIRSLPPPVTISYSTNENITEWFYFNSTANWDAKSPFNMTWSMPNGQNIQGMNIRYQFPVYNELNTVIATFQYGNHTYSETFTVRMIPATPSISFSPPSQIPVNTLLNLNATVSDPDSSSILYSWDVNGTSYSGNNAAVYFSSPGTYQIKLTVTDSLGASATVNTTISVLKPGHDSSISISITKATSGPYIYFNVHVQSLVPVSEVLAYVGSSPAPITQSSGNSTDGNYNVSIDQRSYSAGLYGLSIDVFNNNGGSNSASQSFAVSSTYGKSSFNLISIFGGVDNFILILLSVAGIVLTVVWARPKPTDIDIDGTVLQGKKGKALKIIKTPRRNKK